MFLESRRFNLYSCARSACSLNLALSPGLFIFSFIFSTTPDPQSTLVINEVNNSTMFEKGDQIIDSYTNEVLGTTETLVGTIKITSVSSNYSKATSTQKIDLSDGFEPGKYIVRPVKIDEEAAEKAKFKKAKKKIKEKRKELQESLDEDW